MDDNDKGFLVTNEMMYHKLNSIDAKVTKLTARDERDYEVIQKHESQLEWLKRIVYMGFVPVTLLASVVLGLDKLQGMF